MRHINSSLFYCDWGDKDFVFFSQGSLGYKMMDIQLKVGLKHNRNLWTEFTKNLRNKKSQVHLLPGAQLTPSLSTSQVQFRLCWFPWRCILSRDGKVASITPETFGKWPNSHGFSFYLQVLVKGSLWGIISYLPIKPQWRKFNIP